jgi:hypothetical protein
MGQYTCMPLVLISANLSSAQLASFPLREWLSTTLTPSIFGMEAGRKFFHHSPNNLPPSTFFVLVPWFVFPLSQPTFWHGFWFFPNSLRVDFRPCRSFFLFDLQRRRLQQLFELSCTFWSLTSARRVCDIIIIITDPFLVASRSWLSTYVLICFGTPAGASNCDTCLSSSVCQSCAATFGLSSSARLAVFASRRKCRRD